MPISDSSFEQGKILPEREILALLQKNEGNAYTIDEIYRETVTDLGYSIDQLSEVLASLEAEKKIESKQVEGHTYYRVVRRRLGFQPSGG